MKDKFGTKIYVGDIVYVLVKSVSFSSKQPNTYSYIGRVSEVKSFKTGYGIGGYLKIIVPGQHGNEVAREAKYITKLPAEQAMLWKLENE